MIVDFFMFLLPFTPNDFLFVGHHLMTTGYMMSSLYIGRGGLSCLILMVLGESTSLFQNSWLISRELRRESKVSIIYLTCCAVVVAVSFLCKSMQAIVTACCITCALLASASSKGQQYTDEVQT